MTASDSAIPQHVVIQCPNCGACESAEAAVVADHAMIVCRECGETWPAGGPRTKRRMKAIRRRRPRRRMLVAERRPLVTYSNAADTAWAAKIAGDHWPEPRTPWRLPITAAAMASVVFFAAFFGGREAAVAALPDLAGLYAAIGLPVNLDRLAIEDVKAERTRTFEGARVTVSGSIRNIGAAEQAIPPLAAILYDDSGSPAGAFGFASPAARIGAGEVIPILMDLSAAPDEATEVVVRFRRSGETLPTSGPAQPAAQ